MKKILYIFIVFILVVSNLNAENIVVKRSNKTKDGIPYSINITLTELKKEMLYSDIIRFGMRGIDIDKEDKDRKNTIIADMNVKYNGKDYKVPLSAYCDLGELNENCAWDKPIKNGFILHLYGGLGKHGHFEAKCYFINGKLIRRELKNDGFTIGYDKVAWEATYYQMDDLEEDEPAKENNPTKK